MDRPAFPSYRVRADTRHIPLRDASIPLIVTSPPYNVAIRYELSGYRDHIPWPLYRHHARLWAAEMARVLQPGGRVFLNVQPTVPRVLAGAGPVGEVERVDLLGLWTAALTRTGLLYRDVIVWTQDAFDGACQWGAWCRPSAPNMRGSWEAIIVVYKERWKREPRPAFKKWKGPREDLGGDWVDLVRNVWKIQPAKRAKKGTPEHFPAAFPIEVPARCIRLGTWPTEIVLDPFAGSSTTGRAAELLDRRSVMLDLAF